MAATREVEIISESYGPIPRIDEVRLVGNQIHVYSTIDDGGVSPNTIVDYTGPGRSEPVAVTVPDRDYPIVYYFAKATAPQSELYYLRRYGDSILLFSQTDANLDRGWLIDDPDPATGSTAGLDFTPTPTAPNGLFVAPVTSDSTAPASTTMKLFFDESPSPLSTGVSYVRRYDLSIEDANGHITSSQFVAFDGTRFVATDTSSVSHSYGGVKEFTLPHNVYSWKVRVQYLPVFPDSIAGGNALGTPWSDWSEEAQFANLPKGQQIQVGKLSSSSSTGITTINWGTEGKILSSEVWINRISDGKKVLHETAVNGFSYQTALLDPGNYRVWVRATRADGTLTRWSSARDFTVQPPYTNVLLSGGASDATPTIEWTEIPQATKYEINVVDPTKERWVHTSLSGPSVVVPKSGFVYSRTMDGSRSSHTIETPLPSGFYRVDVVSIFANGTRTTSSSPLTLRPPGSPIAVPRHDSFTWKEESGVVSYDVWVSYLGTSESSATGSAVTVPIVKFEAIEEVTTNSYDLPANAPFGNYRIWLRPNRKINGQLIKGEWSVPVNFQSLNSGIRPPRVTQQGETLTWQSVPGVGSYKVIVVPVTPESELIRSSFDWKNREFRVTDTTFTLPDEVADGKYYVWVKAANVNSFGDGLPSNEFIIEHGTSPWKWNVSNTATSVTWNTVPDADSYDIQIAERDTNAIVVNSSGLTATNFNLPSNLAKGHYRVSLRAHRSRVARNFDTEWDISDFDHGVLAPENVQLTGSILSWDGQAGTDYSVSLRLIGDVPYDLNVHKKIDVSSIPNGYLVSLLQGYNQFNGIPVPQASSPIDLSPYLNDFYATYHAAKIQITVQAKKNNPGGGADDFLTAVSDTVDFALSEHPPLTNPIVEQSTPVDRPAAPLLSAVNNSLVITSDLSLSNSGVGANVYRTVQGAAIDVEYIQKFQLRVTDVGTGVVTILDETQIPELLQLDDKVESSLWKYVTAGAVSETNIHTLTVKLGLNGNLYKVEARVQYQPVIQQSQTSDPYNIQLAELPPDHIHVAATPWSAWSNPLEYTFLPDDKNILPLSKTPMTINPRPMFEWKANTPNAQYELWVENRTTRQRVLHEILTDVHAFQPTSDLPAGQYDWWVRIVGTTGQGSGWSKKQSLEIFASSLSTNVTAETADATPIVSWNGLPGVQSYVVTFTSRSTGKVVYVNTAATNVSLHRVERKLPNDTYTVSIQAVFPNGGRTAPGAVDSAGIFQPKTMTVGVAPKDVTFTSSKILWQAVNSATRYEVWINYISPAGNMETIFHENAYGTEMQLSANLTTRPGEYRVWIRAIRSESGEPYVGRWSVVKSLHVHSSSTAANALAFVMSQLAATGLHEELISTAP